MFRKKRAGFPPLNDPQVVRLLRLATVDMNYGAVQELYTVYGTAAPADGLWDWWLDQAESLARSGDRETVALAIDFTRKANVEPWGSLDSRHYDRMRAIENL